MENLLNNIANAFSGWTKEKKKKKPGNFINDEEIPSENKAQKVQKSINKAMNMDGSQK